MNLLRGPILRLRCSPYGCTAALLDATSTRSRRFSHPSSVPLRHTGERISWRC